MKYPKTKKECSQYAEQAYRERMIKTRDDLDQYINELWDNMGGGRSIELLELMEQTARRLFEKEG